MVYKTLEKKKQQASSPLRTAVSSTTILEGNERSHGTPSQPSIMEAMEKQTPLQSSSKRAKEITDAITHFLAKDSIPFNAVERPGFKRLLNVLEPCYEVPANVKI